MGVRDNDRPPLICGWAILPISESFKTEEIRDSRQKWSFKPTWAERTRLHGFVSLSPARGVPFRSFSRMSSSISSGITWVLWSFLNHFRHPLQAIQYRCPRVCLPYKLSLILLDSDCHGTYSYQWFFLHFRTTSASFPISIDCWAFYTADAQEPAVIILTKNGKLKKLFQTLTSLLAAQYSLIHPLESPVLRWECYFESLDLNQSG